MDGTVILKSALTAALVMMGVGGVGGAFAGMWKEATRRAKQRDGVLADLPKEVMDVDALREQFIVLIDVRQADKAELMRVARRCKALLITYQRAYAASAHTVQPAIITSGRKLVEAIRAHLKQYYVNSRVAMLRVDRSVVPTNPHLRAAHSQLLAFCENMQFNLTMLVQTKLEEAGALRFQSIEARREQELETNVARVTDVDTATFLAT